jgi:hypothetical protein
MINEACNSGGLSSMETGGKELSDCKRIKPVTKRNGNKEMPQNILVYFLFSSSFSPVLLVFIRHKLFLLYYLSSLAIKNNQKIEYLFWVILILAYFVG